MGRYSLRKEKGLSCKYSAILMVIMLMTVYSNGGTANTLDELKSAREGYIEYFRVHGKFDTEKAKIIESRLKTQAKSSKGKLLAQTLFELATIQRINNQFETAISTYERAAVVAQENLDMETAFDIWMGVARSHVYGARNHGAAAAAFERAVASAGSTPTQKQRYDMADYSSQLQAGRGELESALLNALEATKLAQDHSQRFYAYLHTGDVLQKFAESCDYRKIVDAKTVFDNDA